MLARPVMRSQAATMASGRNALTYAVFRDPRPPTLSNVAEPVCGNLILLAHLRKAGTWIGNTLSL